MSLVNTHPDTKSFLNQDIIPAFIDGQWAPLSDTSMPVINSAIDSVFGRTGSPSGHSRRGYF